MDQSSFISQYRRHPLNDFGFPVNDSSPSDVFPVVDFMFKIVAITCVQKWTINVMMTKRFTRKTKMTTVVIVLWWLGSFDSFLMIISMVIPIPPLFVAEVFSVWFWENYHYRWCHQFLEQTASGRKAEFVVIPLDEFSQFCVIIEERREENENVIWFRFFPSFRFLHHQESTPKQQ